MAQTRARDAIRPKEAPRRSKRAFGWPQTVQADPKTAEQNSHTTEEPPRHTPKTAQEAREGPSVSKATEYPLETVQCHTLESMMKKITTIFRNTDPGT